MSRGTQEEPTPCNVAHRERWGWWCSAHNKPAYQSHDGNYYCNHYYCNPNSLVDVTNEIAHAKESRSALRARVKELLEERVLIDGMHRSEVERLKHRGVTSLPTLEDNEALRTQLAVCRKALALHVAYEAVPSDRGGHDGPKGKAWTSFITARDAALNAERGSDDT